MPSDCERIQNVDTPDVNDAIIKSMKDNSVSSAWLSIYKHNFKKWLWMDKELYGKFEIRFISDTQADLKILRKTVSEDILSSFVKLNVPYKSWPDCYNNMADVQNV